MEVIRISVLVTVLIVATIMDYKFYRIPNICILLGIITGILMHPDWVMKDLAQMAVIFVLFYPFYKVKGLGAGDVKLMMLLGCFFEKDKLLNIFLFAFFIAAVMSVIKIILNREARNQLIYGLSYLKKIIVTKTIDPYECNKTNKRIMVRMAIPIAIGTLLGGVIIK